MCRKRWRSFRQVRLKTSTVSSVTTSSCAHWFTRAGSKSINSHSNCANHTLEEITPAPPQALQPHRQSHHDRPPFHTSLIPPHIHLLRWSLEPPVDFPRPHRRTRRFMRRRQTAGHSTPMARCRYPSCNSESNPCF